MSLSWTLKAVWKSHMTRNEVCAKFVLFSREMHIHVRTCDFLLLLFSNVSTCLVDRNLRHIHNADIIGITKFSDKRTFGLARLD